jgi:hypothetical protein
MDNRTGLFPWTTEGEPSEIAPPLQHCWGYDSILRENSQLSPGLMIPLPPSEPQARYRRASTQNAFRALLVPLDCCLSCLRAFRAAGILGFKTCRDDCRVTDHIDDLPCPMDFNQLRTSILLQIFEINSG